MCLSARTRVTASEYVCFRACFCLQGGYPTALLEQVGLLFDMLDTDGSGSLEVKWNSNEVCLQHEPADKHKRVSVRVESCAHNSRLPVLHLLLPELLLAFCRRLFNLPLVLHAIIMSFFRAHVFPWWGAAFFLDRFRKGVVKKTRAHPQTHLSHPP